MALLGCSFSNILNVGHAKAFCDLIPSDTGVVFFYNVSSIYWEKKQTEKQKALKVIKCPAKQHSDCLVRCQSDSGVLLVVVKTSYISFTNHFSCGM